MNIRQALAEAHQRWGLSAHVRDRRRPSSPEARAAARPRLQELKAQLAEFRDPLSRRICKDRISEQRAKVLYRRFSVGEAIFGGSGFLIRGEGDTWEAAFEAAERKIA